MALVWHSTNSLKLLLLLLLLLPAAAMQRLIGSVYIEWGEPSPGTLPNDSQNAPKMSPKLLPL